MGKPSPHAVVAAAAVCPERFSAQAAATWTGAAARQIDRQGIAPAVAEAEAEAVKPLVEALERAEETLASAGLEGSIAIADVRAALAPYRQS